MSRRAAHRFLSQWTRPKTPEYFDLIVDVFQQFPGAIVRECVDPMRGIGRTIAPNGGPRIYPPEVPEIIDWCDALRAEYTIRVKPPSSQPRFERLPVPPPPTAEEAARVQATVKKITAGLARAMGRKSDDEQLSEAQQILHRYEREAKEAAIAAVQARQSPPSDGAHAARAYADLARRRGSAFDDPDLAT
jgi:hypothetical protein